MVKLGHQVTCYNRGGHHVSGKEFDGAKLHEYEGVKLKTVPTINGKGLAAVSSSFFAALASAFARSCFQYAVDTKQDLWFSTKDIISKQYDHTFKDIFQEIYDSEYKEKFEALGIEYFYTLIDDAVARVIRSKGGFIWACKNRAAAFRCITACPSSNTAHIRRYMLRGKGRPVCAGIKFDSGGALFCAGQSHPAGNCAIISRVGLTGLPNFNRKGASP